MNRNIEKKAQLIENLIDVRRRIFELADTCPTERYREIFSGTWSLRELLAHFAGWDETNIQAAREIMDGKLPSFYAFIDKDWKTYNAMLVERYGREELKDQLTVSRQAHQALIEFLQGLPADDLWADRGIRARGWKVTIGRLLEVEAKDEEIHYQDLKAFLSS
jgi:hypothetical protein